MRISDWAKQFGIWVEPATAAPGEIVLRVKDIWTTHHGSWELSDQPGSVPAWARADYLLPLWHPQYNHDGGGARHLFGAVLGERGMETSGAIHFYTYTDNRNHVAVPVKPSGWANIFLNGPSAIPGPWAWQPANRKADLVKGGGLPGGEHISFYVVWEPVTEPGSPVEPPPIDPPIGPDPGADVLARLARLERAMDVLVGAWREVTDDWVTQ